MDSDSLVPHLDPFRDCRRRLLVIYLHDSKDAAAVLSISPRTFEATLSYRASVLRLVLPVSLINDAQINERILRHVGSKGGLVQWVNEIRNHGVRIAPSTDRRQGKSSIAANSSSSRGLTIRCLDYDRNPPLWQV